MNNSVKALIVISFNEGRQVLLEQYVPLEWVEWVGEGMRYLQKKESSLRRENNR